MPTPGGRGHRGVGIEHVSDPPVFPSPKGSANRTSPFSELRSEQGTRIDQYHLLSLLESDDAGDGALLL